jgi:hypothetical protein
MTAVRGTRPGGAARHESRRPAGREPLSALAATAAGPLLVLGPPRSSQSLLAFAIGQHPECHHVLDTSWLPRLAEAMIGVHRAATQQGDRSALTPMVAPADLVAAAGAAVAPLLAPTTTATPWVTSGTVATPEDVALLLELFPTGRIVHLVRHPDAVVQSLATTACGDGRYASRPSAYRAWLAGTRALVEAERAYGSSRIHRITTTELLARPEAALSQCLGMIGLPLAPPCATALKAVADLPTTAPEGGETVRSVAVALYDQLTGTPSRSAGDPATAARIQARAEACTSATAAAPDDGRQRYRLFVQLAVPEDTTAAVVSKGDPTLVDVPGRRCCHLPRTAAGDYLGHHPADSTEALRHLRGAVETGSRYLIVPGASHWWLDHYDGLADHLRRCARLVAHHQDIATVYELTSGS